MTRHDDSVRLRHMLDHSREAVATVHERTREDLDQDRLLELALVRLIEMVGEAAARVSEEGRAAYSTIPWRAVVGMRNRLIHGYDTIDRDVLWDTIAEDLPPLIRSLEGILEGA
ncbi:MAG: HepT-like ribonuclease domain-containing protein [Planctomycetota bacterium]